MFATYSIGNASGSSKCVWYIIILADNGDKFLLQFTIIVTPRWVPRSLLIIPRSICRQMLLTLVYDKSWVIWYFRRGFTKITEQIKTRVEPNMIQELCLCNNRVKHNYSIYHKIDKTTGNIPIVLFNVVLIFVL